MRRKWLLIAGAAVIVAAGAGSAWFWRRNQIKKAAAAATPPVQQLVLPPGTEISLSGKVQARHVVEVPASVEGTIETFYVDVGQEVYEGQLLASIKNSKLESARDLAAQELEATQTRLTGIESAIISARLEGSRAAADASRAKSEFDQANKVFQRQRLLYREGATPRLVFEKTQKDFEAAQAELNSAQDVSKAADGKVSSLAREVDLAKKILDGKNQELEQAKADLAATEVHSPVDGILLARRGEVGSEVTRDTKDLFQIATDLSDMVVAVEPEPPVLQRLEPGMPAAVIMMEANNDALPGQISAIQGTQVLVEFNSPSLAIKPGLTAQVRLRIK